MKTSWRELFVDALKDTGEQMCDIVHITLSPDDLDDEFYDGYGAAEGKPFTAWSDKYVYFPACYDGAEWVGYVLRNPCDIATDHIGGG